MEKSKKGQLSPAKGNSLKESPKRKKSNKKANSSLHEIFNNSRETTLNNENAKKKKKKKREAIVPAPKIEPAIPSDDEEDEEIDEQVVEEQLIDLDNEFLCKVPKTTYAELFSRIETQIPSKDTMLFKTRVKKIDWEKVAFDGFPAAKCQQIWLAVQKRQRNFRTLSEVVSDAKTWMDAPWKQYKSKANKCHPDFPKRPLSSYMLFYLDAKDPISKANPHMRISELAKVISEKYKTLKESHKKKYAAKAAANRENYEEAVREFYKAHPDMQKDEEHKANLGPKKPLTPFALFLQHQKKNETEIGDKGEFRAAMKLKWTNLPVKKKINWIKWASEMYDGYKAEYEAFKIENPDTTVKLVKPPISKEEIKIRNNFEGVPEKPPSSAYSVYTRILLSSGELEDVPAKERLKAIGDKWKELPPAEKQRYQTKYEQASKRYKEEYETYLQGLPEDERAKLATTSTAKKRRLSVATTPKKVTKKALSDVMTPVMWEDMEAEEKNLYLKAVNELKNYFDTKHSSLLVKNKEEPNDSSDSSDSDD